MASKQDAHAADEVKQISRDNVEMNAFVNFGLGGVAGVVAATIIYPLDMVKSRLQFQSTKPGAQALYRGPVHAFKTIIQKEGAMALYRGMPAQWIGIIPEKSIKLAMNDFMRNRLHQYVPLREDGTRGDLPVSLGLVAGCTAGLFQVTATAPYECVKIRLQVQGGDGQARKGLLQIVRELGVRGMYRGTAATLLRDIPFTGTFFAFFSKLKEQVADEVGYVSMDKVLACGAVAGTVSAFMVTPADVIKTRIQAQAAPGEFQPTNIRNAFSHILKNEGLRALFKGASVRCMVQAPLFGITMQVYELLQGMVYPPLREQRRIAKEQAALRAARKREQH